MNRRGFLTSSAATGSVIAVSGCLGVLGGGGDDTGPADGVRRDESNSPGDSSAYRIDFVDQAGTLGQVAQPQTVEDDYNNIVNEYSENDWQAMDDNDLQVARNEIEESGRGSVDSLRSYVEDELGQSPADEADVRPLVRGIGIGMNEETGISDSFSSANVLKAVSETFAREFLDSELQAWITGATEPATEGEFAHLPITIAYRTGAGMRRYYIEPSVPEAIGLGGNGQAIRKPEDSVYADSGEREMVTGHEYRKALEMAQNGRIGQESGVNPIREISTNLLSNMWSMVDSGRNDISWENPPPNGLVTHVSKEFGRSVEDAFYDLTEQRLKYMENVGRGVQLFYEEFDGRSNLAVGGTLVAPEFYLFSDSKKETAWNFEYDDISELVG